MAGKKKVTKTPGEKTEKKVTAAPKEPEEPKVIVPEEPKVIVPEEPVIEASEPVAVPEPKQKQPKYKIGSIVYVAKDAEADLNGFKLFPQYKKYTYTVEAYDGDTDVYTLRRLNLSLRLESRFILAPDERAHDPINRKQF